MAGTAKNVSCGSNTTVGSNGTTQNISCSQNKVWSTVSTLVLSEEARITLIFVYCLIFLLGVLGNSLVCFVVGRKKVLSGGDVFILSLAVADLLAAIFVPILVIHDLVSKLKWYFGAAMCNILPSISPVTLIASSWSMVLIAADRFRVIVQPMKPRISIKIKFIGIVLSWMVAVGLTMPYTLALKLYGERYCLENDKFMTKWQKDFYIIIWLAIGWILPLVIVAILYWLCGKDLRASKFGTDHNDTTRKRVGENKKVVNLFVIIVVLFAVFTLPYSVFYATTHYLLAYRRSETDFKLIWTLNYVLFVLTNMNSCMNPFVYARKHKEINVFVRNAWKRICCKASDIQNSGSARTASSTVASLSRSKQKDGIEGKFTNKAFSGNE